MPLYNLQFDGGTYHVEAPSMKDAIDVWKLWGQQEWGADHDGTEEPESCALIDECAVLRREQFMTTEKEG